MWLTVSFTIERYIVICHPIKGKILCTEGRAKGIIAIVAILCFLTTMSTTFEYQLALKEHCVEFPHNATNPCFNVTDVASKKNNTTNVFLESWADEKIKTLPKNDTNFPNTYVNVTPSGMDEGASHSQGTGVDCADQNGGRKWEADAEELVEGNAKYREADKVCNLLNNTCCAVSYTIFTESTELGKNITYTTIFYWFSSITFGLLPLILIAGFNCFLVNVVYKSQNQRQRLTNSKV